MNELIQGALYPNIVIKVASSINGLAPIGGEMQFGTVISIFPGCDSVEVNSSVFFDATKGKNFKDTNSIDFYVIDQKYIYFIEKPVIS